MLFYIPLLLATTVLISCSFHIHIHFEATLLTTNASVNTKNVLNNPHHASRNTIFVIIIRIIQAHHNTSYRQMPCH